MIHNEQKKWFLYSTLPPQINKLFIYMPTANNPMAEKALGELADYLHNSLDVIGKLSRVDTDSCEGYMMPVGEPYPIVVFNDVNGGVIITHNQTDIAKAVSNHLPVIDIDLPTANRVKALKDGKDLL